MRIIAVDAHMLNTFESCQRKFNLSIIRQLEPIRKPDFLERGDVMHKMLHAYYWGRLRNPKEHHLYLLDEDGNRQGDHPFARLIGIRHKDLVDECVKIGRSAAFDTDLDVEQREFYVRTFVEYAIHYAGDGWMPLEIEQSFSKVIYVEPDVVEGDKIVKEGLTILIEGIVDLVTDTPFNGISIIDHKGAKQNRPISDLSNQFMCYSWALGNRNIIVNRIGFQTSYGPEKKFTRIPLSYSSARIAEWRYWAIYWAKLYLFSLDNEVWPPNFTSCDKFAGCAYKIVCETTPDAREDKIAVFYREGEKWSPHTRDSKFLSTEEGE